MRPALLAAFVTGPSAASPAPTVPSSPTITSVTPSSGQVIVDWELSASDGGSAITSQTIEMSTAPGTETPYVTGISPSTTTRTITGLTDGTTYYFRNTSTNAVGPSTPSGEWSATPATVPTAPTLTATPGVNENSLSWTNGSNGGSAILSTNIYRGTSPGAESMTPIATVAAPATSWVDETAEASTEYYYKGANANAVGTGTLSAEVNATPTSAPPTGLSVPTYLGYTSGDKIFSDYFTGSAVDSTKWTAQMGAGGSIWNAAGNLTYPFSGTQSPRLDSDQQDEAVKNASQNTVSGGVLTMTAIPNPNPSGPYYGVGNYIFMSGVLCSYAQTADHSGSTADFVLPKTGKWLVQCEAIFSDMSHGSWPGLWFLGGPAAGGQGTELDFIQGGFTAGTPTNNCPLTWGFVGVGSQATPNLGFDSTAAYHIYAIQFDWDTMEVSVYIDNNPTPIGTKSASGVSAVEYEIILNLQMCETGKSWHTPENGTGASWSLKGIEAYATT